MQTAKEKQQVQRLTSSGVAILGFSALISDALLLDACLLPAERSMISMPCSHDVTVALLSAAKFTGGWFFTWSEKHLEKREINKRQA
jgi:hypothetical protein